MQRHIRHQGLHHVFNPGGGGGQGGGAPGGGGGVGDEAPWIAGVWGRSPHRGQGAEPPGKSLRKLDNFDAFSSTWGTRIYISSN